MRQSPAIPRWPAFAGYVWALLLTSSGTALLGPLREHFDLSNLALLYVLAVVSIAASFGRGPAVACALMSALLFAYVFVPPHFSLAITEAQNILTAIIMLVVALVVGHLTSRLKRHADFVEQKSIRSARLYSLAQALTGAADHASVTHAVCRFFRTAIGATGGRIFKREELEQDWPEASRALLQQCCTGQGPLSRPTGQGCFYLLIPLTTGSGIQGVLGFEAPAQNLASQDAIEFVETAASVIAVALERSHFAEVARQTEIKHAAESLRSSILAALSHDLRTPLTGLVGTADTLALGKASPERQKSLLASLRDQALSISRQMTNLLDMARLSAGKLQLQKAWQPVEEVIGASLQLVRDQWPDRIFHVDIAPKLPPLEIDAVLIERVLWNLLENAIKYAPAHQPIEILARQNGTHIDITVCDCGSGLPEGTAEALFEVFQRGETESSVPGVGLGLSIAKTIVEAHQGHISAQNRPAGGACFCITLPIGSPPDFSVLEETA